MDREHSVYCPVCGSSSSCAESLLDPEGVGDRLRCDDCCHYWVEPHGNLDGFQFLDEYDDDEYIY